MTAAQGFGSDPERYDRARPRYPETLTERILRGLPGRRVLDVGSGTGIVARQFQAAGCDVLGVEADPRMADFARSTGVDVEVTTFEDWDASGREFDAVVSGQSWHWVDMDVGAAKAAAALRHGGRLAVFWNTGEPAGPLADAFGLVYRQVLPESFAARLQPAAVQQGYAALCGKTVEAMRRTGAFDEPEQWRFEWQQGYSRDEWLDALPTSGVVLEPTTLTALLDGIGAAIDAAGGSFTMSYVTIAVTATRL